MFSRWGRFVYRFRRPVALLSIALAIGLSIFGVQASSHLSSGGWLDTSSESAGVDETLARDFGVGRSSLIVLFRSTASTDATSPEYQAAIATTLAPLVADPDVAGVVGFAQTGDRRFISTDGKAAYALMERLFPLCRSLTGGGVRATFDILAEHIPISCTEVPDPAAMRFFRLALMMSG